MDIECQGGLSQQILGKEHSGQVRGVGFGPSITQIFGHTIHQFSEISLTPPIQTKVDKMKLELELDKLKVEKLESVVETERLRQQAFEGAITRILLQQGGDLLPELAAIVDIMMKEVSQFHQVLDRLPQQVMMLKLDIILIRVKSE